MEPLLKQRLIGAITLVVLGVLIIPVILNGPPDGRRPTVINQPVIETATPQSSYKPPAAPVTVRVDANGKAATDPVRKVDKPSERIDSPSSSSSPVATSQSTANPGSNRKALESKQEQKKPSKPASASPLLSSKPIDRYSSLDDVAEPVPTKKVDKPRVQSKPKVKPKGKPSAPKKTTKSEAKRVSPAPQPKPLSKPKRQRYVIQMGIFGEESNAIKLRRRLEKLGYRVTVDKEYGRGDAVYRVYVGPYPHRQAADASREALLRRAKLRGFLKNYP